MKKKREILALILITLPIVLFFFFNNFLEYHFISPVIASSMLVAHCIFCVLILFVLGRNRHAK